MNQKYNLFLILLLLSMTITAFAGPVDRETARQQADAFARQMGRQVSKQQSALHRAPAVDGTTPYYVYNTDNDQGFIIVSGDDRAVPILGYTETGHFDVEEIPDNMRNWLEGYALAISQLDSLNITGTAGNTTTGLVNAARVEPLMKSLWNQTEPYSNKCPVINGKRCPTGCVATAMSQIMYYHRWPREATKSIPAYSWDDGAHSLSALPSVTFNWNGMQDTYNGNVNGDAVSTLMQYAGQSLKMFYAPEASSAFSQEVVTALTTYFNYDANMQFISRDGYSVATWENLVYQELVAGRPVYYSGASFGGGHAFVADGYDGNGLFHINWGWGGWCDGFFRLSVLNPDDHTGTGAGTSSDGFCMGQQIIIGIQPATGQAANIKPKAHFSRFEISNDTHVVYDVWNTLGFGDQTFELGIGVIDENGKVKTTFAVWTTQKLTPNTGYVNVDVNVRDYLKTVGTYTLRPVSRKQGSSEWLLDGELAYIEAVVSNNRTVTLKAYSENFDVTDIQFPGSHIATKEQQVNVQIKNKGDEVNRELYLFAYKNNSGDKTPLSRTALYLEKDSEETLNFFFTPETEGIYTVDIALDDKDSKKVGTATVTIGGYILEPDLTTVAAKVSASHAAVVDAENVSKAIDDNLSTKYCCYVAANATVWIRYQLDSPVRITSYTIASANDAPERDPATWRLQGSNDGNTWEDIDKQTNQTFNDRFEAHDYTVNTTNSYSWIRLYVDSRRTPSSTVFQLSELQLRGVNPETDGFVTIQVDNTDDQQLYTIDGRPVNRQSLKPGVYVSKGKKVIINTPSR